MTHKSKQCLAAILFAVVVIVNLTADLFDFLPLIMATKPLLLPLLLLNALLVLSHGGAPKWLSVLLSLALCFHCLGDIVLLFEGSTFFALGLAAFLIGHIFYIFLFAKKGIFRGVSPLWIVITAIVSISVPVIVFTLLGLQGPIKYAVFVYAGTLLFITMCGLWGVFNKKSSESRRGYIQVFVGGLSFLCSDFILAWTNLLSGSFPNERFVVMLTYLLAECMIASCIVHPYLPGKNQQ